MDYFGFKCFGRERSPHEEEDNSRLNPQTDENAVELNSRKIGILESKMENHIRQIETMCAAQTARNDAVLERLNLGGSSSALKRGPRQLPQLQQKTRRDLDEMGHDNGTCSDLRGQQRSPEIYDEEEEEGYCSRDRSYCNTPDELRAIPLIKTPDELSLPPIPLKGLFAAPPLKRRLPVIVGTLNGPCKEIKGGYRLSTARGKMEVILRGLERLHPELLDDVPQSPLAPKQGMTETSDAPFRPTPPPKRVPPTNTESPCLPRPPSAPAPDKMGQSKKRRRVRPLRAVNEDKAPNHEMVDDVELEELNPLPDPEESLSVILKPIDAGEWEEKIKRLQSVRAMAQHHPDTLKSKLIDVCFAVIAEVKNLRSCVASAAMDTVVYMHYYLQKDMDNMADHTGAALLQKVAQASANNFLQEKAKKSLDSMVINCSPAIVLNVLRTTGLTHRCASVRASAAQKMHLLVDALGAAAIMSSGKSFKQNMVVAVNTMCVDASSEVRPHGLTILEELAMQPKFMEVWDKQVPEKDRPYLGKVLKKIRKV